MEAELTHFPERKRYEQCQGDVNHSWSMKSIRLFFKEKGYLIFGKFDQFKRDISYSAIIQAFQELCRQLLTESAKAFEVWKEKILKAFGHNGQVIIDLKTA